MARVFLPLMSLDATDTLAKAITFSKWKGRNYIRKRVKPSNPRSGLQLGMRAGVSFMSKDWASLSAAIQTSWKTRAKKLALTGLDSFVQFNQPRIRRGLGVVQNYTNAAGAVEAAPTAGAAAAGTRQLTITWVDSVGANDWCTFVYKSTSTGFTPSAATLVAIIPKGTQKYVDIRVTTGTPYYYVLAGSETGGTLGTLAAQFTGTPN